MAILFRRTELIHTFYVFLFNVFFSLVKNGLQDTNKRRKGGGESVVREALSKSNKKCDPKIGVPSQIRRLGDISLDASST